MTEPKKKLLLPASGILVMFLLLWPTGAGAQFGSIFSAITSTITGPIGGALSNINQIRTQILQTEQQVLWPLALITQAQSYITTIKATYRGWMNNVFALPVNSAILPTSQSLESSFLSAQSGQIGSYSQIYPAAYGVQPGMAAAPMLNLQMMDIEDSIAQDAIAASSVGFFPRK